MLTQWFDSKRFSKTICAVGMVVLVGCAEDLSSVDSDASYDYAALSDIDRRALTDVMTLDTDYVFDDSQLAATDSMDAEPCEDE